MATLSLVHRAPAREAFYVIRQEASATATAMVTVLHRVPAGSEQLGVFDSANRAIDFAEAIVRDLNGTGSVIELVDPPYGLVGAG